MSEMLDQNEIDRLLGAVGSGSATLDIEADASPHARNGARSGQREASSYDFKRPERVSKEQTRALSSIHEVFARNFGAVLSGFLRTIVDVRVVGVEQLTYSEFIHSLPNPTCFVTMTAPPLEGQMCLELSPLIVYPIIDRLLGGSSTTVFIPQRPLTSIEWRLTTRIVSRALELLSEVWRNLIDAKFQVHETESNPELVHIVAPTEVVLFITFEIKLGQNAGTMSLCIPYNTIETVLSRLTTQAWFYKPRSASPAHQKRLMRNLARGAVDLTAYFGETRIRLNEFRALQAGDVLPLDKLVGAEFVVQVEGRNKFVGALGSLRGKKAIQVTRPAQSDEPL